MKTICYCFNYTDVDIIDDVLKNKGRSLIEERIAEAKKTASVSVTLKIRAESDASPMSTVLWKKPERI